MKRIFFISIAISLLWATSCQHKYYAPNGHIVPIFQQKNEARILLSKSMGNDVRGQEIQAAYSITNHIGIVGATHSANVGSFANGFYYEGGVGGFKTFKNHFVLECYGGYGNGRVLNNFDYEQQIRNRFHKYFIQPSIAYSSKYFDFALSSRFVKLNLYGLSKWQPSPSKMFQQKLTDDYTQLQNNKNSILIEPGFTLRVGWKYLKIQTQLSASLFVGRQYFSIDESNVNIGAYFTISAKDRPAYKSAFNFNKSE